MSLFSRPWVYARGLLVVTLVGVVGITPAESRSPSADETRAAQCSVRVIELEAEVRALREQLRLVTAAQNQTTQTPTAGTTRRFSAAQDLTTASQGEACNPPFRYDGHGIKYYRRECLTSDEQLPACTVSYATASNGSKHDKSNCVDAKPSLPDCDPPYEFDSRGVKSYKSACF